MKTGDIIEGNCPHCFSSVDLEFRYNDEGLNIFKCTECGNYIS